MNLNDFSVEIYKRYGPVTRARNCFLYTKKGSRLTDLYQENGRAILGWHGGNAFTHLKNTLSRGQTGSFICEEKSRVQKAVSNLLFSERNIFYYSTFNDAIKNASQIQNAKIIAYTPWLDTNVVWNDFDCIILEPPLPWTQNIYILAVKSDIKIENHINSIKIPFALENAVAKSFYNLIKEIQVREEKNWFIYDTILTKYFTRKGPYLTPKIPEKKYDEFLLHCLDCGIILNPDYNRKSIIPYGADKGVFTKLKNNPFNFV